MIVADASVLFPYVFEMETSPLTLAVRAKDADWRFPRLWRQEFSSALLKYVRAGRCPAPLAEQALSRALRLFSGHEAEASDLEALAVAQRYGLSAYDALYVALARRLDTVVVTADLGLARRCPGLAVPLGAFGAG